MREGGREEQLPIFLISLLLLLWKYGKLKMMCCLWSEQPE